MSIRPRNFVCSKCGRESYKYYEECLGCKEKLTIQPKKSYLGREDSGVLKVEEKVFDEVIKGLHDNQIKIKELNKELVKYKTENEFLKACVDYWIEKDSKFKLKERIDEK